MFFKQIFFVELTSCNEPPAFIHAGTKSSILHETSDSSSILTSHVRLGFWLAFGIDYRHPSQEYICTEHRMLSEVSPHLHQRCLRVLAVAGLNMPSLACCGCMVTFTGERCWRACTRMRTTTC